MFVSKRKIGGKHYFYLEDRIAGKRVSFSLGRMEEAAGRIEGAFDELVRKRTLENLKASQKNHRANILSLPEQMALERLKVDYELMEKFFPQGLESFREDEFIRYAQGSASVEGNSLSLREAALVLEKGISIAGKRVEEIREIENMRLAADVSKKIREINGKNIKKINAAILKGFDGKIPGKYRTGPVFMAASEVKPPQADKVEKELGKLFAWLGKNEGRMHPVDLAAEFHARFEEIHPFNDGNGRTGREILNIMLKNAGYPRAIINLQNRQSYIALLERLQLSKEYGKFSRFVYACMEKRADEIGKIIAENKKAMLEKIMKGALKSK